VIYDLNLKQTYHDEKDYNKFFRDFLERFRVTLNI